LGVIVNNGLPGIFHQFIKNYWGSTGKFQGEQTPYFDETMPECVKLTIGKG
jgi:hypothetical protein